MDSFRSSFFKVLLDNSVEFLTYSIEDLLKDKSESSKFIEKIRNLPLFIVPNENRQWFSFIYSEAKYIPPAIQNFLFVNSDFSAYGKDK